MLHDAQGNRTYSFCVFPVDLVADCSGAAAKAHGDGVSFKCVGGVDATDCMKQVRSGSADMLKIGGEVTAAELRLLCACPVL